MTPMHRAALLLAGAGLAALPAVAHAAGDATAGRRKAVACAVCHGPQGVSVAMDAPHLAGQPAMYLGKELRAYRSGARLHEVMSLMAKPLSDDDIADLAAWFAAQKISVQAAP